MIPLSYFTAIGFRKPFGEISVSSIPFSLKKASAVLVWIMEDTSSSGVTYLTPYLLDRVESENTFGT